MAPVSSRFSCTDDATLDEGLAAAKSALAAGELVVLPTDTVYGLAADAFEPAAVRRLLEAKGRDRDMPPPVLVASPTTLDALATDIPSYLRDMISELWPGPLTVICHQQPSLSWDLGDTRETVAVRMPDNPYALALLKQTGPLAVSSANTSGEPAAEDIEAAELMLGDAVAVYLDGGPAAGAVPSTIVDVTGRTPRIAREGAVPASVLAEYHIALAPKAVPEADELPETEEAPEAEEVREDDEVDTGPPAPEKGVG